MCAWAPLASAQQVVAPTLKFMPSVAYPEAARAAGVSGDVTVRAAVAADGRVTDVVVLSVPKPGLGFEEFALAFARNWEFNPGTNDGMPAAGVAVVSIPFRLALDGDYVFDVPPERALAEIHLLLRTLGFKPRVLNAANNLLATRGGRYRRDRLPPPEELGFTPKASLSDLSWTVAVSPLFRNARVSISNEVDVHDRFSRFRMYRNQQLSAWLAARIGERLGMSPVVLSEQVDERTKVSPAVPGPAGQACVPAAVSLGPGVALPKLLREVKPFFPADAHAARKEGVVLLQGTVTEHGTLTAISVIGPTTDSVSFRTNAVAAAMGWRFSSPMRADCPVQVPVTIQMEFRIR